MLDVEQIFLDQFTTEAISGGIRWGVHIKDIQWAGDAALEISLLWRDDPTVYIWPMSLPNQVSGTASSARFLATCLVEDFFADLQHSDFYRCAARSLLSSGAIRLEEGAPLESFDEVVEYVPFIERIAIYTRKVDPVGRRFSQCLMERPTPGQALTAICVPSEGATLALDIVIASFQELWDPLFHNFGLSLLEVGCDNLYLNTADGLIPIEVSPVEPAKNLLKVWESMNLRH